MSRFFCKNNGRKSSIELLRILAVMGVVILHYNNKDMDGGFSYVAEGSLNHFYLFFSESVFVGAVNLFVMISAYYLSATQKRSFTKIIELVFQVSLFRVVFYLGEIVLRWDVFSFSKLFLKIIPNNYFVFLYSAVYIISPYFNLLLDKLEKQAFRKLLITSIILFSIWTIVLDYFNCFTDIYVSDLSTISMYGSMQGYTVVNFCLAYLIGAYIRRFPINTSTAKLLLVFITITIIIFILSLVEYFFGSEKNVSFNYNNPLVLGVAAFTLMLFLRFNFHSKIINELAGATFICYLTHLNVYYRFGIHSAVRGSLLGLIVNQVIVASCCYIVAYIIFKLYSICLSWLFKLLKPLFDKVNLSVDTTT